MDVKKTEGQAPAKTGERPLTPAMSSFLTIRDEMDRLFDSFLLTPFTRRLLDIDPFRRRGVMDSDVTPRMDVVEAADAIEVTLELPGIDEKDIDITMGDGMVSIRGEKKVEHDEKKGDFQLSERSYGTFTRSFRVPDSIDEERVEATFEKGVLTLHLPKTEQAARDIKKIEVKTKH